MSELMSPRTARKVLNAVLQVLDLSGCFVANVMAKNFSPYLFLPVNPREVTFDSLEEVVIREIPSFTKISEFKTHYGLTLLATTQDARLVLLAPGEKPYVKCPYLASSEMRLVVVENSRGLFVMACHFQRGLLASIVLKLCEEPVKQFLAETAGAPK